MVGTTPARTSPCARDPPPLHMAFLPPRRVNLDLTRRFKRLTLAVWWSSVRSKVFLYAVTSIMPSMLQAMISIIHSPTACFVGPWKRDGQTDSLGKAPSKQGVLVCHDEHHSLNASGHDQHNSLADCLLCRSVEKGRCLSARMGSFKVSKLCLLYASHGAPE